jgi:multidrug efflux system outer membrane protein
MKAFVKHLAMGSMLMVFSFTACVPAREMKDENRSVPNSYKAAADSANTASIQWRKFFNDPYLIALVDTALSNNQELNIILQEIDVAQNEVMARKGEYLPSVDVRAGAGVDKTARYTPLGANEATTEIEPGREMPEPVPDFMFGAFATWELDIWNKLHNAKKAAALRYLATTEGKNFMVTHLIAEIANTYYELLALDNQLDILQKNIALQTSALEIVKMQKQSARVTELAVRRFEAQVLKTRSLQYAVKQQIIEAENRLNFLVGRFPQHIDRDFTLFNDLPIDSIAEGVPSQLLANRPDIRQAEYELAASRLDVKVARARFYPSLSISAGVGLQAFDPTYLIKTPQSMLYSLAGELASPLINRKAIKAAYFSANSKQIQAVYAYEQTILKAYIEVYNQVSNIDNLKKSYDLRKQQVQALTESIDISNDLFRSARADYMEVLLTQRDALESKFELIETKKQQLNAKVNIYQALGGGWN